MIPPAAVSRSAAVTAGAKILTHNTRGLDKQMSGLEADEGTKDVEAQSKNRASRLTINLQKGQMGDKAKLFDACLVMAMVLQHDTGKSNNTASQDH